MMTFEQLQAASDGPDADTKNACQQRKNNGLAKCRLSIAETESAKSIHHDEEHPWAEPTHSQRHPIQPSPGRHPKSFAKGGIVVKTTVVNDVTIAIASWGLHHVDCQGRELTALQMLLVREEAVTTNSDAEEFVKPMCI